MKRKNMLDKYDEEIDGEQKKSFVIGDGGSFNEEERIKREREKVGEWHFYLDFMNVKKPSGRGK